MTPGFFQLTVLLAFAATVPLHGRVGIWLGLGDLFAYPAGICLLIEIACVESVRARFVEVYRKNRYVYWYVLWAGIAAVIGTLRTTDTLKTFKDLLPGIVLYTLIGMTVDTLPKLRTLIYAVLTGIVVQVVLAIPQALFGGPYLMPTSPGLEAKLDVGGNELGATAVGLFGHPNGLGFFLMPFTLFFLAWLWQTRAKPNRWLLLLLVIDLWLLRILQVKGTYAFLAVGLLVMAWPARWERKRWIGALAMIPAAVGAIMWFSINQFVSGQEAFGTLVSRLELWNRALDVTLQDRFTQLFGSGYALFQNAPIVVFDYPNAHNAWLNQILSYGLPALACYLAAFVVAIRVLATAIGTAHERARVILLAGMASLVAILGESFFEPVDIGDLPTLVFLLLAGAIALPATARE